MEFITLPNGYNGDTVKCYAEPIQKDKDLLKLRCAEEGKEYMIRWVHKDDYNKAMKFHLSDFDRSQLRFLTSDEIDAGLKEAKENYWNELDYLNFLNRENEMDSWQYKMSQAPI